MGLCGALELQTQRVLGLPEPRRSAPSEELTAPFHPPNGNSTLRLTPRPWAAKDKFSANKGRPLHLPRSRAEGPQCAAEQAAPPALPGKPRLDGKRSNSSSSGVNSSADHSTGLPIARGLSAPLGRPERFPSGRRRTGSRAAQRAAARVGKLLLLPHSPSLPPGACPPSSASPNAGAIRGSHPPPSLVPALLQNAGLSPRGQSAPGACPSKPDHPEFVYHSPVAHPFPGVYTLVVQLPPRSQSPRSVRKAVCVTKKE